MSALFADASDAELVSELHSSMGMGADSSATSVRLRLFAAVLIRLLERTPEPVELAAPEPPPTPCERCGGWVGWGGCGEWCESCRGSGFQPCS